MTLGDFSELVLSSRLDLPLVIYNAQTGQTLDVVGFSWGTGDVQLALYPTPCKAKVGNGSHSWLNGTCNNCKERLCSPQR